MAAQANTVGTKKGFLHWARSRRGQQTIIIIAFMIIPLALLFTFTYLPFGEMVGFSFYKMKYVGKRTFVGWKNYASVFSRKDCFGALKLSLYYMGGSVVQLVLALYLATILSFKVKGGNIFKGFMFFPYLINGIAIGFIFKFFYTRGFVFDTVLQWCGFQLDNLPYWLKDQSINNISLVGTSVWRYFGQNMVLFIGAIMSVDSELYEAAMLDGANRFEQFRYIILPSIKTIVTLNVILSITGSLSAFEPPYVITSGAKLFFTLLRRAKVLILRIAERILEEQFLQNRGRKDNQKQHHRHRRGQPHLLLGMGDLVHNHKVRSRSVRTAGNDIRRLEGA